MTLLYADDELLPRDELSEQMYMNMKYNPTGEQALLDNPSTLQNTQLITPEADSEEAELSKANPHETHLSQQSASSTPKKPWKAHKILAGAHQGWVRSVAIDPVTNQWFALGLTDSQIKVWDIASGDVRATILGHIMAVRSLVVSQRHPYLFSGSEDKTLRCWDLEKTNSESGCQIRNYHGHVGGVYALALHPELDVLFSSGRDSAIRAWDVRSRVQAMALTGHSGDVTALFAQTGDPQVCLAGMDGTVRLWDLRNQKCALTLTQHAKGVRLLVKHPHELTMASVDATGTINQWVLPGGQLLNSFKTPRSGDHDTNIINTLAINPSTNELFAGFADGRMQFWDYEQGNLTQQTATRPAPGTPTSTIYASTFDMLGMRLITCENDKSIKIWSL